MMRSAKLVCLFVAAALIAGAVRAGQFPAEKSYTSSIGTNQKASGLFDALSFDQGKTWPVRRLITDGDPAHQAKTMDGRPFTMSATSAEPKGYMAGVQSPDGIIHLISSWNHYAFNAAWLKTPMPAEKEN